MTTTAKDQHFDPLDMNSYSLNKLPKRQQTKLGKFFQVWGLPIAAIIFVLFSYVIQFPILNPKQQVMFGLFATAFPGKLKTVDITPLRYRNQTFNSVIPDNAAIDQTGNHPLPAAECGSNTFNSTIEIHIFSAGKKIDCGIFMFRPGVNGKV